MIRRLLLPLLLAGCTKASSQGPDLPPAPVREEGLVRCVDGDGPLILRSPEELERRALDAEEKGHFGRMLACAEEALRLDEESGWAAHLRAEALAHLGRSDAAQEAFVLALALSPEDPYLLAGLGDFYANHLPPSRERSLAALHFARRGLGAARDVELVRRLHLVAGWAEADLGRFEPSLAHGRHALRIDPEEPAALLVAGRALFELTRFQEAEEALRKVLAREPQNAEAHYLLGLSLEWTAERKKEAEAALAEAASRDPSRFPLPVELSDEGLAAMVADEVQGLPARERVLLVESSVSILLETLPSLDDLRAEEPPLSPTALGMFRGQPVGLEAGGPREILLYSRNLRRAARNLEELRQQVRITLLHEIGHLLGEDEASLRARGLE